VHRESKYKGVKRVRGSFFKDALFIAILHDPLIFYFLLSKGGQGVIYKH
jgi:hypothetical protein